MVISTSWNKITVKIMEKINMAAKHNRMQKVVGEIIINLVAAAFHICKECCYL